MLTIVAKMMTTAAPTARRAAMALRPRITASPIPAPVSSVLLRRERTTWASAKKSEHEPQHETKAELQKKPEEGAVVPKRDVDAMDLMPFRRMSSYMEEMQKEMDDVMSSFGMPRLGTSLMRPYEMMGRLTSPMMDLVPKTPAFFNLRVDLEEDDKAYTLRAEVPGFSKDDVKVTISPDGLLTISGNKEVKEEKEEGGAAPEAGAKGKAEAQRPKSRMMVSSVSSFTRSFRLPPDVRIDDVKAATKHGVLTITVPKTPAPTPKEVPVNAAE